MAMMSPIEAPCLVWHNNPFHALFHGAQRSVAKKMMDCGAKLDGILGAHLRRSDFEPNVLSLG